MYNQLCGWCITKRVRPEFLAGRAADCPGCAEHRAYKEAVAKPGECTKNPYHLCSAGKPCVCECHRVDSLLPREVAAQKPKPKLTLKKRSNNARKALQS